MNTIKLIYVTCIVNIAEGLIKTGTKLSGHAKNILRKMGADV